MNNQKAETVWEKQSSMEYLRNSRKDLWNLDYFEFLFKQVWKTESPVNILDFGCGMGYLGAVLLPLLPEGSTYTGMDIGEKLLDEARATFANSPWKTNFIQRDLTQYEPKEQYDLAICQCVLVHIPSPLTVLEKMVQSTSPGGRIICIEPNWLFTNMGVYRHGMEIYSYYNAGIYQKWFDNAIQQGKNDGYIGIKIPALMNDLGLTNIDIRINDKARFTFHTPDKAKLKAGRPERDEKMFYINDGGLSPLEAIQHAESRLLTQEYENNRDEPLPMVEASAWLISYGEKPK